GRRDADQRRQAGDCKRQNSTIHGSPPGRSHGANTAPSGRRCLEAKARTIPAVSFRLALHTWTLDTTPLADALRTARETGWDAVELRRVDFVRAAERGMDADAVMDLVKKSGLPVACVGVEHGWMWAEGDVRRRLLRVFTEQCERASRLGCTTMMSPVDVGAGDVKTAAGSGRRGGDRPPRH